MNRDENVAETPEDDASAVEPVKPAGFWIRLVAYFIDSLIIFIPSFLIVLLGNLTGYLIVSILLVFYKPLCEGYLGGTAGKLALNLRVIHINGQLLGFAGGIVRSGFFILPMLAAIVIQVELIQSGVSIFDEVAMAEFEASHHFLYMANYVLSSITISCCASVLLNRQKRGIHDFIAQSQVIYHKQ